MPKNGFNSITVRQDVYHHFKDYYVENKESLQYIGVNSFAGFVTWIFQMVLTDDYIHDRLKGKIKNRAQSVLLNLLR